TVREAENLRQSYVLAECSLLAAEEAKANGVKLSVYDYLAGYKAAEIRVASSRPQVPRWNYASNGDNEGDEQDRGGDGQTSGGVVKNIAADQVGLGESRNGEQEQVIFSKKPTRKIKMLFKYGLLYQGWFASHAVEMLLDHSKVLPCYVKLAEFRKARRPGMKKANKSKSPGRSLIATLIRPGVGAETGVLAVLVCVILLLACLYPICGWILEREKLGFLVSRDTNIPALASRRFKYEVGQYALEGVLALFFCWRYGLVNQLSCDGPGYFLVAFGFLFSKAFLAASFDACDNVLQMPMQVFLVAPLMQFLSSLTTPFVLAGVWLLFA
ncbi:unnamed protein product, partial [Amoebophrya sp. A120]